MYDDSQVNNNIPRFDSQTGEPLFPQADSVQNVQADTDVNAATGNYNQNVQADTDVNATTVNYNQNVQADANVNSMAGNPIQNVQTDNRLSGNPADSYVRNERENAGTSSVPNNPYTYYNLASASQPQKSAKELKREEKARKKEAKRAKGGSQKGGAAYIAKLVASAVVFGLIAGGIMFGVNKLGERLDGDVSANTDIPFVSTYDNNGNAPSQVASPSVVEPDNAIIMGQTDIKGIIKSNMPSIVAINGTVQSSYGYAYPFGGTQVSKTSGTGIIVGKNDTELLIVTNAHVVDGVNDLTCTFIDEEQVEATVKGSKSNKDIAVIAVQLSKLKSSTISSIAIAELGDSDSVELGDQVIAIGNALGEGQSVTVGYISALDRTIVIEGKEYSNLIRTDAAINPGNSGGALINSSGKVIGINTAKYGSEEVEGMGYAIPISSIRDILDTLMNKQTRTKVSQDKASYLGISGIDITYSISQLYKYPRGILLQVVKEGSPAAKAGLVKNDIIVSFDGDSVTSLSDLKELLQYYEAGEKVTIEYYHMEDGEYRMKTTEVTLAHNQ